MRPGATDARSASAGPVTLSCPPPPGASVGPGPRAHRWTRLRRGFAVPTGSSLLMYAPWLAADLAMSRPAWAGWSARGAPRPPPAPLPFPDSEQVVAGTDSPPAAVARSEQEVDPPCNTTPTPILCWQCRRTVSAARGQRRKRLKAVASAASDATDNVPGRPCPFGLPLHSLPACSFDLLVAPVLLLGPFAPAATVGCRRHPARPSTVPDLLGGSRQGRWRRAPFCHFVPVSAPAESRAASPTQDRPPLLSRATSKAAAAHNPRHDLVPASPKRCVAHAPFRARGTPPPALPTSPPAPPSARTAMAVAAPPTRQPIVPRSRRRTPAGARRRPPRRPAGGRASR